MLFPPALRYEGEKILIGLSIRKPTLGFIALNQWKKAHTYGAQWVQGISFDLLTIYFQLYFCQTLCYAAIQSYVTLIQF